MRYMWLYWEHLWSDSDERGVYKSSDAGETWEKILYIDEKTGAADMTMDPKDPSDSLCFNVGVQKNSLVFFLWWR